MDAYRGGDPERYVIGVDYGTLSGRPVVVRVSAGAELGSAVLDYPNAVMDRILNASGAALPVPADYVAVLKRAVPAAVRESGIDPAALIGIGTDFTACTMVPTLADGTPLNELPEYVDRPHAYVKLWKHHGGQGQADRITRLAVERGEPWLGRYGGLVSSEWEFAKGLQLLEEDRELYDRMAHWVEAADWIVWQLTGEYVRSACTAGYKGLYQDGVYPSKEFLGALNPDFADFAESRLGHRIGQLGESAGRLTAEAAAGWTGLPPGIAVAVGNVDAHVTVPAAQAVSPGQMVAVMGTSTCHVMNGDRFAEVPGTAGSWGYEAGQSGVDNQVPGRCFDAAEAAGTSVHQYLTDHHPAGRGVSRTAGIDRVPRSCSRTSPARSTSPGSSATRCRSAGGGRRTLRRVPERLRAVARRSLNPADQAPAEQNQDRNTC